jgi:hypothetical protein
MKNFLFVLLAFAVFAVSCKKDEETKTYSLSGDIKNLSERVVGEGTVNLLSGTTVSYSATISTAGKYSITGIAEGSYTLSVVSPGYVEFEEAVSISSDQTKNATLVGGTIASGVIIDSQTGSGLANAQIALTFTGAKSAGGITVDTTLANADFVFFTDAYGYFNFEGLAFGYFIMVIRADGFTTRVIENIQVFEGYFDFPQVILVQTVSEGSLRMILTWGENPYDLDSHLTGPMADGNRFHMYYSDPVPDGGDVNLDVDDTYSYGPETTTIETFHEGLYRFSIFNFSDQSSDGGSGIYTSPTRVEVYDYSGLVSSFTAPAFSAGTGNTWRVLEINVSGGTYNLVPVNVYLYSSSSSFVEKSGDKKPAMIFNDNSF